MWQLLDLSRRENKAKSDMSIERLQRASGCPGPLIAHGSRACLCVSHVRVSLTGAGTGWRRRGARWRVSNAVKRGGTLLCPESIAFGREDCTSRHPRTSLLLYYIPFKILV